MSCWRYLGCKRSCVILKWFNTFKFETKRLSHLNHCFHTTVRVCLAGGRWQWPFTVTEGCCRINRECWALPLPVTVNSDMHWFVRLPSLSLGQERCPSVAKDFLWSNPVLQHEKVLNINPGNIT